MRINVVFNLETVDELKHLTQSLEGTATLQAKIMLENRIKSLKKDEEELIRVIHELREERNKLQQDKKAKWEIESVDLALTDSEEPEPSPEYTALDEDAERVIESLHTVDEVEEL
jgi:hypothetical protein